MCSEAGTHQQLAAFQRAALHGHLNVYDGEVLDHARCGARIQLQQSLQRQLHACLPLDPLVDMRQDLQHLRCTTMVFISFPGNTMYVCFPTICKPRMSVTALELMQH